MTMRYGGSCAGASLVCASMALACGGESAGADSLAGGASGEGGAGGQAASAGGSGYIATGGKGGSGGSATGGGSGGSGGSAGGDGSGGFPPEPPEGCVGLDTGYAGDEACVPPPAPGQGFQVHLGPSDYSDPEQVARYIVSPGEEGARCAVLPADISGMALVSGLRARFRPGVARVHVEARVPGAEAVATECDDMDLGATILFAPQSGYGWDLESDPSDSSALALPAGTELRVLAKVINTTPEVTLAEAWINAAYSPDAAPGDTSPLTWYGGLGMEVPPMTTTVVGESGSGCPAPGPARLFNLVAEVNANTVRASVHVTRWSGARELVYEAYDWADPGLLSFDAVTQNPIPDASSRLGGGFSGTLLMEAGDVVQWECEISNATDVTLRYSSSLYLGERCNVFGIQGSQDPTPWMCMTL
jgi:hypothetical protein